MTLADVASGELPRPVDDLTSDPEVWATHSAGRLAGDARSTLGAEILDSGP